MLINSEEFKRESKNHAHNWHSSSLFCLPPLPTHRLLLLPHTPLLSLYKMLLQMSVYLSDHQSQPAHFSVLLFLYYSIRAFLVSHIT